MEIVLAMGAAAAYGASDFVGGLLSKRIAAQIVVLSSQVASLALVLGLAPLAGGALSRAGFGWGLAAGIAGGTGAAMLYRGLARGQMNVVAPISGVLAAAIPVVFGLAFGERPGALSLTGVALGLVAVLAVTRVPAQAPAHPGPAEDAPAPTVRPGIGEAIGAGAGFGLFFVLLERAPDDSGVWPLIGMRISMIVLMAVVVLSVRGRASPPRPQRWSLAGLGVINTVADLLYLLATRRGLLSLVGVITSLYPASTVVLAAVVLKERMSALQAAGLALAGVSIGLIAWP